MSTAEALVAVHEIGKRFAGRQVIADISLTARTGEIIGLVGSTGNSTAPHLHFEIRIGGANGQRIDPYPTLQAAGC